MTPTNKQSSGHRTKARNRIIWVLVLLAFGAYVAWPYCFGWTVQNLENLIQAEVSQDSDRQEVESCLDRRGIRHIYEEDFGSVRFNDQTPPTFVDLREDNLSGMVIAQLSRRQVRSGILEIGTIYVFFFFDRQGKLAGHWIKRTSASL